MCFCASLSWGKTILTKLKIYGKITLFLGPVRISDNFKPGCHILIGFWVTYCHLLSCWLILWSRGPNLGGDAESA